MKNTKLDRMGMNSIPLVDFLLTRCLLAFLSGAVILSLFSIWQKISFGVPVNDIRGYIVPVLFGGISGVLVELWNRKARRALRQLQISEALYRAVVEHASDGIFIMNDRGQFLDVNAYACSLLGYSREELLQLRMKDMAAPAHSSSIPEQFHDFSFDERTVAMRQVRRKDGSIFMAEISSRRLPDGNLQAIVRDVTEREAAAQALRESEEKYRLLTETARDFIISHDFDGRITYANKAAIEMIGCGEQEIQQLNLKDLLPDDQLVESERRFAQRMAGDQTVFTYETELIAAGGRHIPLEVTSVTLVKAGKPLGILIIGRDITERKRTEEALRQMQKTESLGVLAGGVAHDFNNLLVAMLGQTSLAQAKLSNESPARPHIEKAVGAAERAADLTRQMLAYSGRGHFETRPINLNSLITENLHLFQASLPKNIHLRSELSDSLPLIMADAGQMQQVIMNLIINGAQSIEEESGQVMVTTGVMMLEEGDGRYTQYTGNKLIPGQYVTLEVSDNGRGMPADTLSKIFDPFFSTKETGHGLGLAAVLGVVRGHRGGLTVYSEVGEGTIFKLLFPVSQDTAEPPTDSAIASHRHTKGLILIIDDEVPVREAVTDIMALEDIEVISASGGAEGVALYRERQVDIGLVLLDLSMPGMNGAETFRQLRRINPDVRVILSSGYNQIEATRRFTGKGLAAFIQKPYTVSELIIAVKQHLL